MSAKHLSLIATTLVATVLALTLPAGVAVAQSQTPAGLSARFRPRRKA